MRVGRETGEEWGGGAYTPYGFSEFHKDIISVIIKF